MSAVLVRVRAEFCVAVIVTSSSTGGTGVPAGSFAPAVAVFTISPASRFSWLILSSAVKVVVSPGASVATLSGVMLETPCSGSLTQTSLSVTLPVFVTAKL